MSDNLYGDIELDAKGMRALAHPVRLRLLNILQRHGPSTATALSEQVGATPSVVSWHLRHLAKHGLVRDSKPPPDRAKDGRERWWAAAARGVRLSAPSDDEGQIAFRTLSRVMMDDAHGIPVTWADEVEPLLDPSWREHSGLSNTRIVVSLDELAELEPAFERLLAPYVLRKDEPAMPAGTRSVRILHYVLPDAEESTS